MMVRTEHAELRAKERYGITATDGQWSQALLDILDTVSGDRQAALLVAHDKRTKRERWLVHLGGVQVVACYIPKAALIVSVLPSASTRDAGWRRPIPFVFATGAGLGVSGLMRRYGNDAIRLTLNQQRETQ